MSPRPRPRGFTLVEILVVVAIIVILMAILIPTAMGMISKARNAAIGVELGQLRAAFEKYKEERGDYPPSMGQNYTVAFRYGTVCERHLLRAYPRMDPAHKTFFYDFIAPRIGTDEALVFWLAIIANDPRYPFKNIVVDNNGDLRFAPQPGTTTPYTDYPGPYPRFAHYDFDERRIRDLDSDIALPSYIALYCRDTPYVYFDSRTYLVHCLPGNIVQPMTDGTKIARLSTTQPTNLPQMQDPNQPMFMNPNTFQIHCAGQDGDFGLVRQVFNSSGNFISWDRTKQMPDLTGLTTNQEDSDNMADFTEGLTLVDHQP